VVVRTGQGVDENLEFTLYPSPATHSVNLVSNGQSGFSEGFFRVTDINGKWIKSGSLVQGKSTTPIDLHELNPGLYYVVVTSALYSPVILKFIKK
jgi:hypothetical protein